MARKNEKGEWVDFHTEHLWQEMLDGLSESMYPICFGLYRKTSKTQKAKCESCGYIERCIKKRIRK